MKVLPKTKTGKLIFMGYAKIDIIGHLGRDPEIRTSGSGTDICNFSVAVSEKRKEGNEWNEHTTWYKVSVFGKQAASCQEYLSKGKQVFVSGTPRLNVWTDRDGKERTTLEIAARDVQFIGSKSESGSGSARPAASNPREEARKAREANGSLDPAPVAPVDDSDEIPF